MVRCYERIDVISLFSCLRSQAAICCGLGKFRFFIAVLAFQILTAMAGLSFAEADEPLYWMRSEHGGQIVKTCPGSSGTKLKVANRDGKIVVLSGMVICRDTGSDYSYELKFLSVSINDLRRSDLTREKLQFDWMGLAVYGLSSDSQTINWLYDTPFPIDGTLDKQSEGNIYFGNLIFAVPKEKMKLATRFLFYLTAQNIFFPFEVLP